ncbi:hypothetical protein ACFQ36_02880 [Arthrobacter sp. GCM10027362]|uniref:hypothetical protein n=1 Tax=Arthrobacter sp. GCM10027362 TaxID=3273379 RepID=UPI00362A533B
MTWLFLGSRILELDLAPETTRLIDSVGQLLPSTVAFAIITCVAYVVGILLVIDTKRATSFMSRYGFQIVRAEQGRRFLGCTVVPYFTDRRSDIHPGIKDPAVNRLVNDALYRAEERKINAFQIRRKYKLPVMDHDEYFERKAEFDPDTDEFEAVLRNEALEEVKPLLLKQFEDELPKLATKLHKENKDLYDAYDRDRSEAEFRLSIAPPLILLAIEMLAILISKDVLLAWVTALVCIIAAWILLRKGWRKVMESASILVTALEIGTIRSDAIYAIDSIGRVTGSDGGQHTQVELA